MRTRLPLAVLAILSAGLLPGCKDDHADIEFTGMTVSPVNPQPGDTVTVTVTAANFGGERAGGFAWTINRDAALGVINGRIAGLEPGEHTSFTFPVTETEVGTRVYRAILNSDNAVSESSYSNNSGTLAITYALAIDLQVAPLTTTPASPTSATAFTIAATVTNAAGAPGTATGVAWRVMRDGVDAFASGTVDTLAPGASATVTVSVPAESAGSHTYQFTTDPDHLSTDTDRSNDSQSIVVAVAAAAAPG